MKELFPIRLFERRGRRRLRRIIRGYVLLKQAGRHGAVSAVNERLTGTKLEEIEKGASRLIFGKELARSELITRQYLLSRVAGLKLNKALLYALGNRDAGVVHPLPLSWQKCLHREGFPVKSIQSTLAWSCFVLIRFAAGIVTILTSYVECAKEILASGPTESRRYVYFDLLSAGNLPQPCSDGRSHDVITWYKRWSRGILAPDEFRHNVQDAPHSSVDGIPVVAVRSAVPALAELRALIRFTFWAMKAAGLSLFDMLRGRWWHAVLLRDATIACKVRCQKRGKLAEEYLFHNSGWIYRPLWTYEAERAGAKVTFYFYSTNSEGFKGKGGYPPIPYGWRAISWPNYLVWDEYQADFVRRAVGERACISIVGPIWFNTSKKSITKCNEPAVAVFDVTPFRRSIYVTLGLNNEFYTADTCINFIEQIHATARHFGFRVLWKRKRNVGPVADSRYRRFVEHYACVPGVSIIDPDISAHRVVEVSTVVVSMPFTSTALIARHMSIPSCYYDPTRTLEQKDRGAHGIAIVQGRDALDNWFSKFHAMAGPNAVSGLKIHGP